MKTALIRNSVALLLLLAAIAVMTPGCASPDTDNASVRPWNAPKNWETGLPSMMTEGR